MKRARDVAYSPDGARLAVAVPRSAKGYLVEIRDARSGALLRELRGHRERIAAVAFSHSGRTVASASWDATVRIWDIEEARQIHCLRGHKSYVWDVAFSPDDRRLASSGDSVRLWDPLTGEEVLHLEVDGIAEQVAFSPDGKRLAARAGEVLLWDASPSPSRRPAPPETSIEERERRISVSRQTVRRPGLPTETYNEARARAEEALAADPEDPAWLGVLGSALFRAGELERALQVLGHADARTGRNVMNFEITAFLALTLKGLGRVVEARSALDKLRDMMRTFQAFTTFELEEIVREARPLLDEVESAFNDGSRPAGGEGDAPKGTSNPR
jgi:WD40 repeat protein